jgi:5-methylcytosine-specific restriction endonuclease McrA
LNITLKNLFLKQKGQCFYCGIRMGIKPHNVSPHSAPHYATLDHFIPKKRAKGKPFNKVACCSKCNVEKGDKMPLGFLVKKIKQQLVTSQQAGISRNG